MGYYKQRDNRIKLQVELQQTQDRERVYEALERLTNTIDDQFGIIEDVEIYYIPKFGALKLIQNLNLGIACLMLMKSLEKHLNRRVIIVSKNTGEVLNAACKDLKNRRGNQNIRARRSAKHYTL